MIKKIKSSLFAKVFLLTMIILFIMSTVVYLMLAWFTPHTYSNTLSQTLDEQTKEFILSIEEVDRSDSGTLFDQFAQNQNVSYLELYLEDGTMVEIPTKQSTETVVEFSYNVAEEISTKEENAPVLSNCYPFRFADSSTLYNLVVYGNATQIMELRQSFVRLLPVLCTVIILGALSLSYFFSYIITKPVLKISRISKEMADMKLDWKIKEQRSDELGVLEKSLNNMSHKLMLSLQELESANRQLEMDIEHEKKLEQARIDFFSAVSHELKTPITVIKGQLEGMLLGIGVYRERDKYLAHSLEAANTLEKMVQEILTISRLESTEKIMTEPVNMISLIRGYLEESEDLIVQRELQINLEMPEYAFMMANRLLMEKVFSNIIGNAIKYSPQGGNINILIQRNKLEWEINVENTGVHIEKSELPKLFHAFYRVDQSRNRKTGGSGLGLYITQRILEQYGSICKAENTDAGVKFWFSAPCVN